MVKQHKYKLVHGWVTIWWIVLLLLNSFIRPFKKLLDPGKFCVTAGYHFSVSDPFYGGNVHTLVQQLSYIMFKLELELGFTF